MENSSRREEKPWLSQLAGAGTPRFAFFFFAGLRLGPRPGRIAAESRCSDPVSAPANSPNGLFSPNFYLHVGGGVSGAPGSGPGALPRGCLCACALRRTPATTQRLRLRRALCRLRNASRRPRARATLRVGLIGRPRGPESGGEGRRQGSKEVGEEDESSPCYFCCCLRGELLLVLVFLFFRVRFRGRRRKRREPAARCRNDRGVAVAFRQEAEAPAERLADARGGERRRRHVDGGDCFFVSFLLLGRVRLRRRGSHRHAHPLGLSLVPFPLLLLALGPFSRVGRRRSPGRPFFSSCPRLCSLRRPRLLASRRPGSGCAARAGRAAPAGVRGPAPRCRAVRLPRGVRRQAGGAGQGGHRWQGRGRRGSARALARAAALKTQKNKNKTKNSRIK